MTIFRCSWFALSCLILLAGCREAANSAAPMNDVAQILYGSAPSYEKFVQMNKLLSRSGDTDDVLIGRFKVAGFEEEKSDRPGCRKLQFRSEFRPGKLPHVVAWLCGKDGRFVENGNPANVAQTLAPLTVDA